MVGNIKCSYKDCHKHFKSADAMIQHKIKEPTHDYCKRCDVDCEDDVVYLIHQMNNPSHIACCMCGEEFKSEAGRDAHVEQFHQRSQNLPCIGCHTIFPKAGALMYHIENNECEVISAEIYQRRRAAKQIEKDAWADALDSTNTRSFLPSQAGAGSETDTNGGGVSLLDNDDDDAHSSGLTWPGQRSYALGPPPLQPKPVGHYTAPRPPLQSTGSLSLDKFPSLRAQDPATATATATATTATVSENSPDGDDLLSFDETEVRVTPLTGGLWHANTAPTHLFTTSPSGISPPTNRAQGFGHDNGSDVSPGMPSNKPVSMFDRLSQVSNAHAHPHSSPRAVLAAALPPNNPHARIRTVTGALAPTSSLDPYKYFDPLQNCFVCPGQKCRAKYATPKDFDAHLLTSAHVGGKTVCPSCLRRFNTTAALITHCESGSKKCTIRKSANYNQVMRELTAGLLGTEGHLIDGSVKYVANRPEDWD